MIALFGLPVVTGAVRTFLLSCGKVEKLRILSPVWEPYGESRPKLQPESTESRLTMNKSKASVIALGGALVLNAGGISSALAQCAGPVVPYCRCYAGEAVHAYRAAMHHGCGYLVERNPARWHGDYGVHYRFCLSAYGSGQNAVEINAREAALDACRNY